MNNEFIIVSIYVKYKKIFKYCCDISDIAEREVNPVPLVKSSAMSQHAATERGPSTFESVESKALAFIHPCCYLLNFTLHESCVQNPMVI